MTNYPLTGAPTVVWRIFWILAPNRICGISEARQYEFCVLSDTEE